MYSFFFSRREGVTASKRNQAGFTMIEILVVLAIIGVLATGITLAVRVARAKARSAQRVSDIKSVANGLQLFYDTCGSYPALPPATTALRLNNTRGLYTGTATSCNAGDQVYGANGVSPNGGIGTSHTASAGEQIFIQKFNNAPSPIDDGSLPVGSRCSETNTQTDMAWGDYAYVSFAPADPDHYWLYYCIGSDQGDMTAGRYILTEHGRFKYSGNMFP